MNVRRFLWAMLISAGAMMVVMLFIQHRAGQTAPQPPPAAATAPARPAPAPPAATATAVAAATHPAATRPAETKPAWGNPIYEPHQRLLGAESGYKVRLELTSRGASVFTLKLNEYFSTVADKRRHAEDPATYDRALHESLSQGGDLQGRYPLLNPVGSGAEMVLPLATERIHFPDEGVRINLTGPRWQAGPVVTTTAAQSVTFTSRITRSGRPFVRIEKTYELPRDSYSAKVRLRVVNQTDRPVKFKLTQLAATGMPREDLRTDGRALVCARLVKGKVDASVEGIDKTRDQPVGLNYEADPLGRSDGSEPALWLAQTNRFFAAIAYVEPADEKQGALAATQARAEFRAAALQETAINKTQLAWILFAAQEAAPGKGRELSIDLFAGPKKRSLLKSTPRYIRLDYTQAIQFRSCCALCSWVWLSLLMMRLLEIFSGATLGNYGLAIILLVLLVRVVLLYPTWMGQRSMLAWQKLQPKVKEIREKYKNDKARLNQEMMSLTRQAGVKPMLGCLPMLLQMPIWIALWTGIQAAVELRHAAFLPVWITDLAAPDALVSFSRSVEVPLLGGLIGPITGLNLLPLLLTVAFFLQQKFSPTSAGAGTDQQAATQKQMMYMMPVMMLLFFYNAPSGLTLYIMTSSAVGVVEQYFIRRHLRHRQDEQQATETLVPTRLRGKRKKKPKPFFRHMR